MLNFLTPELDKSMSQSGITILGLGPGRLDLLTREAWQVLSASKNTCYRTNRHPVAESFLSKMGGSSFDHFYEQCETFDEVYHMIVEQVLSSGRSPDGIVYAVPGHPFIAEATTPEIIRCARDEGLPVKVVDGLSFIEPSLTLLEMDIFPQIAFIDALILASRYLPVYQTNYPALIAQLYSAPVASNVKLTLMAVFPDEHPVKLVHNAGTEEALVESIPLFEMDRSPHIGWMTTLYIPPLEEGSTFEEFHEIITHLRSPEGCEWDREQTHNTLRSDLLEEAYEVVTAIDQNDPDAMQEEFGDLLLLILIHCQIAEEEGEFSLPEVLKGIHSKIVRRHPHVFGDVETADVNEIIVNWERVKALERASGGQSDRSLLDGVNISIPALLQALTYQTRAARVGFDWDSIKPVWDKFYEEIEEVKLAEDKSSLESEIGDLFFAAVNLSRWYGIDPESALRQANARFYSRFKVIEITAKLQGRDLSDLSLDEMESIWQSAKKDS